MNPFLLSLLLLAGGSDVQSGANSAAVRGQAVASARIIRGESIRFGRNSSKSVAVSSAGISSYQLPLARTQESRTTANEVNVKIVEFY